MKYNHLRDQNGRETHKSELQRQSRAGWESVSKRQVSERRGEEREIWEGVLEKR